MRNRGFVFVAMAVTGCTPPDLGPKGSELVCGQAFLRDTYWARLKTQNPTTLELERQFVSGGMEASVWFAKPESNEFGSCTKTECSSGRCYWRVRVYAQKNGKWDISFQHDLTEKER